MDAVSGIIYSLNVVFFLFSKFQLGVIIVLLMSIFG